MPELLILGGCVAFVVGFIIAAIWFPPTVIVRAIGNLDPKEAVAHPRIGDVWMGPGQRHTISGIETSWRGRRVCAWTSTRAPGVTDCPWDGATLIERGEDDHGE